MQAVEPIIITALESPAMRSQIPAPYHTVGGREMYVWSFLAAAGVGGSVRVVVSDEKHEASNTFLRAGDRVSACGKEDEISCLRFALSGADEQDVLPVLAVRANAPLITKNDLIKFIDAAAGCDCAVLSNGGGERCAFYFARQALSLPGAPLSGTLDEYASWLSGGGKTVRELAGDRVSCMVVTDRVALFRAETAMRERINVRHMLNGVTFIDPNAVYIGAEVSIGRDTVIYPGSVIGGNTIIEEGCTLVGDCHIIDSQIGMRCRLHSVSANGATVESGAVIGPFVNLRPGTRIGRDCRIGDFVEVKNSVIGQGTKISHLSYVGDADIGERVNFGCGTVVVNYDGFKKHRATVGDDVFLGCQTKLISPVKVGDGAYTAAGSAITDDVPAGALAIARSKQVNKEGWADRNRLNHVRNEV